MSDSIFILSTKMLDRSLIEKAVAHGIQVDCQPFIKIIPALTEDVTAAIDDLAQATAYIALTSVNAVTILSDHFGNRRVNWKVFCISGPTLQAIRNKLNGVEILDTAETGEQLAVNISTYREIKELVSFCSNIRTPALSNGLAGSAISLKEIFLYKTEAVPVRIDRHYDGVLFFSPSAVNSFFSENTVKNKTTFFTIGTTTAKALDGYSNNEIITSDEQSQASLVNKLIEYYNRAK